MSELEARSISNVSDSYISSNSQSLISYVNTKSKHSPSYSIDLHNDAVGEHSSYSYDSPLASSSNISEKSASPFNDYNLYTNGFVYTCVQTTPKNGTLDAKKIPLGLQDDFCSKF